MVKEEIWKTIDELPKYQVSNRGRVRLTDQPTHVFSEGTPKFRKRIYVPDRTPKNVYVQELVLKMFGSYSDDPRLRIHHIDGKNNNDDIDNLVQVPNDEVSKLAKRKKIGKNTLIIQRKDIATQEVLEEYPGYTAAARYIADNIAPSEEINKIVCKLRYCVLYKKFNKDAYFFSWGYREPTVEDRD